MTPQRLALTTADGLSLRAEVALPDEGVAILAGAVLTHPHPLHGGNMFATVTDALFRALPPAGIAVARFNFRGVDGSDGRHDQGVGEQLDIAAAIDELAGRLPADAPLFTASWSFGADVSLAVEHDRLAGWFCVAPPLRILDPLDMGARLDPRPKRLVIPEHDQFNAPERASEITTEWTATELTVIDQADHFVAGKLGWVCDQAIAFAASLQRG